MVKKSIILLCNLFLFTANIQFAYTQDTKQHQEIIELLLEHKIDVANNINKHNIDTTALTLQWHIDSQLYGIKDTVVNPLSNDTPSFINIINVLKEGAIYEDPLFDKELTAFEKYRKALNLSIKKNDSNLIRFSLHKLLKLTFGNRALFNNVEEYAGVYKKYAHVFRNYCFLTVRGRIQRDGKLAQMIAAELKALTLHEVSEEFRKHGRQYYV